MIIAKTNVFRKGVVTNVVQFLITRAITITTGRFVVVQMVLHAQHVAVFTTKKA